MGYCTINHLTVSEDIVGFGVPWGVPESNQLSVSDPFLQQVFRPPPLLYNTTALFRVVLFNATEATCCHQYYLLTPSPVMRPDAKGLTYVFIQELNASSKLCTYCMSVAWNQGCTLLA
jgi:hypothetical protein